MSGTGGQVLYDSTSVRDLVSSQRRSRTVGAGDAGDRGSVITGCRDLVSQDEVSFGAGQCWQVHSGVDVFNATEPHV